jgi:hypothetical protein
MFLSFPSSSQYLLLLSFFFPSSFLPGYPREWERDRKRERKRTREGEKERLTSWELLGHKKQKEKKFLPLLFYCTKLKREQGNDERFCFFYAIIPPRIVSAYCPEKHTKDEEESSVKTGKQREKERGETKRASWENFWERDVWTNVRDGFYLYWNGRPRSL